MSCSSNVTCGFVDLATCDELEKYMYGGPDATAYFVRDHRKATWFTQVPVVLSRASGQCDFGSEWSVNISRAGDYLLHTWLRVKVPGVTGVSGNTTNFRWCRNLMHNLVEECCISFNDLVAAKFNSFHLDFWTAFTVPAGKRSGYNNMIGNVTDLTDPKPTLEEKWLNLPLPFFYTRDSGVALPTAALPYNDMRIQFKFRKWEDLLIKDGGDGLPGEVVKASNDLDGGQEPKLRSSDVQVWANYAIVSNDERKRMACAPRDILIEQVQYAPKLDACVETSRFDLRFSHAIKVLFFGLVNETVTPERSNYTADTPKTDNSSGTGVVNYDGASMVSPIDKVSLVYENTTRLAEMGADYFGLVQPYYMAPSIPLETGYFMYSYSLDFVCLDPMGSTNYGKLTNVSVHVTLSKEADTLTKEANLAKKQTYKFCCTAVNNNVVRISGGALGFPVL